MYTFIYSDLNIWVNLDSIAEIKEYVYKMHDEHSWLAGSTWDWKGAKVIQNGKVIGRVSYNGRVWDDNDDSKEIID